jgi:hypothetical protein
VTVPSNLAPGVALGQAVEKIQQIQADLKTPITLDGPSRARRRPSSRR